MVRINIEVTEEFRKEIKIKAVNNGMTLKEFVIQALKEKIDKEGDK